MKTLKYCPQLNALTGSITASLLMCQLEYWFNHTKGQPFYKFLEPCTDEHYLIGDSWTEEMGFSKIEFRTAFKRIGKIYKSKTEFLRSKNRFEGKLYLSYYDRIKKLTYYMRNYEEASLLLGKLQSQLPYSLDYSSSKDYSKKASSQTNSPTPRCIESSIPYEKIIQRFHALCPSLAKIQHLSKRYKELLHTLCQHIEAKGLNLLDTFSQVFLLVESSDFLCGRGDSKKWRALFSWIIRPDKFFAILEGAYLPFQPIPAYSTPHTSRSPAIPTSSTSVSTQPYITGSSPTCTSPQPAFSMKAPSKFMRMYTHNFDIKTLEAYESAYLEACYG